MTPKMTVRRLVALQDAANNPTGRISPRLVSITKMGRTYIGKKRNKE